MAIISQQAGVVVLGSGDTSNTDTLSTTVTQGNSILFASISGGSDTVSNANVRVALNGAGTTITATRNASGSSVTVRYQVIEADEFTVQHFENTISAGATTGQTITSVDTDYSFVVSTGCTNSGGTRGNDDFASFEITSATNIDQIVGGGINSPTVCWQVVEMSVDEIASVQFVEKTHSTATVDSTITSVDTSKCLVFTSCRYTAAGGGDELSNNAMPIFELTSATNLRGSALSADGDLITQSYVVEFENLSVTSNTSSPTGTTDTEVLGGAPTYGAAIINGVDGKYTTSNDANDDSNENMWDASLSASTWTFTRGASTNTAELSYSVFDWNTLLTPPAGSITAPGVQPIHAMGTDTNSFSTFQGSYSGITPTLIEARVMRSAVEVVAWGSVDSFGAGTFDYTPSIPAGKGYTIEVRTTVSAVLYDDTSDSFNVGPLLLVIGSSSAVRPFTVGSATLDDVSHVKALGAWTEYDSTTETGSPWVELANYLTGKFGAPTGFYNYGAGGTQLTSDWAPPSGASYLAAVAAVEDGNVSAIIEVAGSNDTRNGITLTLSDFTDLYTALRSDVRDCPIIHVGNQRFPGAGVDAEAVAAWIVEQSLADDDTDNYQVWRIDTEISGDNVHNTVTGYEEVYLRAGSCFDSAFGSGTYYKGPAITAAVLNTTTEIALTLDDTNTDYTTITPTTGIAGFRVDGGSISVTNAAVVGSEIILTLGSAASAGDLVEFAAYDEDVPGTNAFTNYPLVNSENVMPIDPITTALVLTQSINLLPTLGLSKSNSLNPSVQISALVELSPSTPRSISNSFDPSVILASLVDVSPSLASSKSNGLDPAILIASIVSVTPAVSRSTSNSLDPSMAIVANVEISPSVNRSASNAANPDVQIGGDISVLPQSSRSASNSLDPSILVAANVSVSPETPLSASRSLDPSVQLSTPITVAPDSIRSISVANDPIIDIDETIVVFPNVGRSVSNALVPLVQVGQAVRIDEFTVNYRKQDILLNYAGDYVAANYGD